MNEAPDNGEFIGIDCTDSCETKGWFELILRLVRTANSLACVGQPVVRGAGGERGRREVASLKREGRLVQQHAHLAAWQLENDRFA